MEKEGAADKAVDLFLHRWWWLSRQKDHHMAVGLGWKQTEHESGSPAVWVLNLESLL